MADDVLGPGYTPGQGPPGSEQWVIDAMIRDRLSKHPPSECNLRAMVDHLSTAPLLANKKIDPIYIQESIEHHKSMDDVALSRAALSDAASNHEFSDDVPSHYTTSASSIMHRPSLSSINIDHDIEATQFSIVTDDDPPESIEVMARTRNSERNLISQRTVAACHARVVQDRPIILELSYNTPVGMQRISCEFHVAQQRIDADILLGNEFLRTARRYLEQSKSGGSVHGSAHGPGSIRGRIPKDTESQVSRGSLTKRRRESPSPSHYSESAGSPVNEVIANSLAYLVDEQKRQRVRRGS